MKSLLLRPGRAARNYPLLSLFDEMNRLFEDTVPISSTERAAGQFVPTVDLKETPTEFVVTGEFPGVEDKDISIELLDNSLTLSGEKKSSHVHKEGDRVYTERSYGSFSRTILFGVEVDEDNSRAAMKNGVLTITYHP